MEKAIRQVLLPVLFAAVAWGQTPAPPAFEAAAIKINNSPACPCGISSYPARIKVINSTLKFCVQMAWDVKDFQVSGATGWMDTEHYDIDAVAANPFTREESRKMMQAL